MGNPLLISTPDTGVIQHIAGSTVKMSRVTEATRFTIYSRTICITHHNQPTRVNLHLMHALHLLHKFRVNVLLISIGKTEVSSQASEAGTNQLPKNEKAKRPKLCGSYHAAILAIIGRRRSYIAICILGFVALIGQRVWGCACRRLDLQARST